MAIGMRTQALKLALPKGRMQDNVERLLVDAGIPLTSGTRQYRPHVDFAGIQTKQLKPQNIVEMLHLGSRDIGFVGTDWVHELGANLVELFDTQLDPVRVVAAAPAALLVNGKLPSGRLVVASEYEQITKRWIQQRQMQATFVRSFGATEAFPPEDADCVVDNTATGVTLEQNGLVIVDELLVSSTRLYANPRSLDDPGNREIIEHLVSLLKSVTEARKRVMIDLNVSGEDLDGLVQALPCMRRPTVSPLQGEEAFAVRAAVPRSILPNLLKKLGSLGATDILVTHVSQILPGDQS